jgi:hypothetical protein
VVLSEDWVIGARDIDLPVPDPPAESTKPETFRAAKARVVRDFEGEFLREKLERHGGNITQAARAAGKDRRFYYNTFDLNRSGWKAVRRRAERSRRKLDGLMDLRALESLWPGPETEMVFSDGITDAQPMKTLVGFALWAEENL